MTDKQSPGGTGKSTKEPKKDQPGDQPRAKWGNKVQFILSCIGYSVGLGNVWRFSYLVFNNGGGAFLIPYVISVVLAGLPLYALELAIGQFGSLGPTTSFCRMTPVFQGFNVAMYYNVIIAWCLHYIFECFRSNLLWGDCQPGRWNTPYCGSILDDQKCEDQFNDMGAMFFNYGCRNSSYLNDTSYNQTCFMNVTIVNGTLKNTIDHNRWPPSREFNRYYILDMNKEEDLSFTNLGAMNYRMVGCLALAWFMVFCCLSGGIQTSGKVVYFTSLFPYLVLFMMLIRGATLPGAGKGILFYLNPHVEFLYNPNTWRKAAVQVFYSLAQGQGGLITMASFNEFKTNFIRDALIVTLADSFTSTFTGFTTFSVIGYMAYLRQVSVGEAVEGGPGLAFEVFPMALATLKGSQFWSVLFFMMMITLGLGTQMVLYETVSTAIIDQFPKLKKYKTAVVGAGCLACFLMGLPYCTQGGINVFTIYDDYCSGYVVTLVALLETVVISWVYGLDQFCSDIERMLGKRPNLYWRITWAYITPLYMVVLFIATIIAFEPSKENKIVMPDGAQQFGWFVTSMPMWAILIFAVIRMVDVKRTGKPWATLVIPTPHWCPAADLAKRSKVRHDIRMHVLEQPKQAKPIEETETTSKFKSGSGGKSVDPAGPVMQ